MPIISIKQLEKKNLSIGFCSANECLSVELKNVTGEEWANSYKYDHISFDEVIKRVPKMQIVSIDHLGVNFPWKKDVHPVVLDLRDRLKSKCLYHKFPSGEPWDFIIPGTLDEISGEDRVDYNLDRKPKFEIVSFDGCSIPLVQFDVSVGIPFLELKELFPEAIILEDIKSLWIYLKTSYNFDVCLVLNERGQGWTKYFKGSRLI